MRLHTASRVCLASAVVWLLSSSVLPCAWGEDGGFTGDHFKAVAHIEGEGWSVARFGNDKDGWGARFEAGGKMVHQISDAGREDAVSFLLYPNESDPKLLFILRFAGGAHGPLLLDAIQLSDGFPVVLHTHSDLSFDFKDGAFSVITDSDGDGWPEVRGYSRAFDYLAGFPLQTAYAGGQFPRVVLAYHPEAKQYRPAGFMFPELMEPSIDEARNAFMAWEGGKKKVPAEVILDGWPEKATVGPEVTQAYYDLTFWAMHTLYAGQTEEAWSILKDHADPVLAKVLRQSIERSARKDYCYYTMIDWMKEREGKK